MSLVPGQPVKASVTNAAYLSRKTDSDTIAVVSFKNISNPYSGPFVTNIQRVANETMDTVGLTEGDVDRKVYSVNNILVNGENHKQGLERLDAEFNPLTGHNHSGVGNEGAKINSFDLLNMNFRHAEWQSFQANGLGISINITTQMSPRIPNGDQNTNGVITNAPYNRVILLDATKQDYFEDTQGQMVYGRTTYSLGTWTLSFYTNENGVETPYSFLSSTALLGYFLEVFDIQTRPTIPSNPMVFGSLDTTNDVVDASILVRGLINTIAQSFAGNKTFTGITTVSNLTDSTINTNGAIIVSGGLGIAKSVFIGMLLDVLGNCYFGKTEIRDVTQSTDKDSGALVIQGGVGIEKNINVGGSAIITGDLTVNGTTTTLNTATLDVTDKNITCNKNGNDVSAEGAGLTVDRTGTDGSLVYADALASKWKAGPLGSESEVVTEGTTQTLAGQKTYNAKQTFNSQLVFDEEVNGASTGSDVTLPTPTKFYHTITNPALLSISGVTALSKDSFILINKTGATVVLKYNSGTIPADGLLNGAGSDIPMRDGSSLFFVYSPTAGRWVILGAFISSENKNEAIAAGGSFSKPNGFSASYLASSTAGEVNSSTTPLGTVAPPADGTEVTFTGFHLTNVVTFLSADIAKGFILNGDCRLPKYATLTVKWIQALDRWVEKSRSQYGIV
jgi:hypothetical protein